MTQSSEVGVIDVTEIINKNQLGQYQKVIVFLIVLVFVMDGVANTVLPIAIPSIMSDWGVARDAFKFVMGIGLFGVAIGATLGGVIADKIGRKNALIGCVAVFGSMTVASALTTNLYELAILRTLDGLGIGGAIPAGMALLFESMPNRRRSLAIAASMVGIPLGGFLAGGLSSLLITDYGWQVLFIVAGSGPLLLAMVLLFSLPESPCFLVLKPAKWDALRELLVRYGFEFNKSASFLEAETKKAKFNVSHLFSIEFRAGTTLIWIAFFFCFIASYSMFSWGPVMMIGQGLSPKVMGQNIAVFNFSGVIGGLLSGWVIQKLGSKPSIVLYCTGGILSAVACAYAFQYAAHSLPLSMGSVGAFGFFIAGILNLTYTMGANMYPTYIKGTGLGAGAGVGRIGAVASAFVGVASLNYGAALGFFTVIAIATCITLISLIAIRGQIPRINV